MVPSAAIWDVDGTLVDTALLHFAAWAKFAAEIGKPFTHADFAATFGKRNPEIIRQLFDPDADDARCLEWGDRKETYYRTAAAEAGIGLLPGARELLDGFAALGWMQAIGSSAPRANLDMILRLTGTTSYFQAVVSGEDVNRGKPDPHVFALAAERLGLPAVRCVVLEDAVAGVEAAKAAGMKCVAILFVGHHPAPELEAAGAALVVPSLARLTAADVARLLEGR